MKKDNPVKVYAVVSQIGFMVITPLLIFIWGGSVLVRELELPQWVMTLFIIIGVVSMASGLISYVGKLIAIYGRDDKKKYRHLSDRRDTDYYDDNYRKR